MKAIKVVIVCLLILFLVGCGKEKVEPTIEEPTSAVESEEEATPIVVEVDLTSDKVMDPSEVEIEKGNSVRWYNKDEGFYHNVVIYSWGCEVFDLNMSIF